MRITTVMRKIHGLSLAFALIAAGALLVSGCKQAEQGGGSGQGQGSGAGSGQGSGSGSGSGAGSGQGQGQGSGSGTTTPGTISATRNFEGILVGKDESTEAVTRYRVTVSLSDGRVGATAEQVGAGHFYIGKAAYDANEGEVSVSLTDVKGNLEPINLAATYEKATDTLVVSEFAGNGEKQLLPREVHRNDVNMHRYNAMVTLPVVGDVYLSLLYNGNHATAMISTGSAAEHGELGSTRAYYGEGYVHRNRLQATVQLEKGMHGTRTCLITADVTRDYRLVNLKVSLKEGKGDYPVYEHGNPSLSALPLFQDARFTLNYQDVNAIHNSTQTNLKAKLILRAEPLLRHPTDPRKVLDATADKAKLRGYIPYGYRMTAQFVGFTSDGNPDAIKSAPVSISVSYQDTDTTKAGYYDKLTGEYTFKFGTVAGQFSNGGSYTKEFPFTISKWRPVAVKSSGGVSYPENVESGEYEITLGEPSAAAQAGEIPSAGTPSVKKFIEILGSARVRYATDNIEHYPVLKNGAPDSAYCFGTAQTISALNKRQARHLFDHVEEQEGFKKRAQQ